MRKNILVLFTTLATISHAKTAITMDDFNSKTCEPSGIINNIKKRANPKEFWLNQFIGMRFVIQDWNKDMRITCAEAGWDDKKCYEVSQRNLEIWLKCYDHAHKKCKEVGGRC